MLKLRFENGLILLGLTDENIARLREDLPILFQGSQVGLDGVRLGIFWAPDEEGLLTKLKEHGVDPLAMESGQAPGGEPN
jgi:hypothetical protein